MPEILQCIVTVGWGDRMRAAIVNATGLFEAAALALQEIERSSVAIRFGDEEIITVRAGNRVPYKLKVGRVREWAKHKKPDKNSA